MSGRRSFFYDVGLQGRLKEAKNVSEQCGELLGNVLINYITRNKLHLVGHQLQPISKV